MKGVAVLVLRYTHPQDREYRVPLNPGDFRQGNSDRARDDHARTRWRSPSSICSPNPKPPSRASSFTVLLFSVFEISEHRMRVHAAGAAHVELDQFNLAKEAELTPTSVGRRARQHPRSGQHLLRPISLGSGAAARAAEGSRNSRVCTSACCAARLPANTIWRPTSSSAPSSSCSSPKCWRSRKKKENRCGSQWPRRTICGKAFCAPPMNLQSSTVVAGSSSKMPVTEQAREIGLAWEHMPEPRPRVTLEIFTPTGPGADFLSRPARAAPHAQRNRFAAQSVAGIER